MVCLVGLALKDAVQYACLQPSFPFGLAHTEKKNWEKRTAISVRTTCEKREALLFFALPKIDFLFPLPLQLPTQKSRQKQEWKEESQHL